MPDIIVMDISVSEKENQLPPFHRLLFQSLSKIVKLLFRDRHISVMPRTNALQHVFPRATMNGHSNSRKLPSFAFLDLDKYIYHLSKYYFLSD